MLLGHQHTTAWDQLVSLLAPDVDQALIRLILGRSAYSNAEEREAETLASLILSSAALKLVGPDVHRKRRALTVRLLTRHVMINGTALSPPLSFVAANPVGKEQRSRQRATSKRARTTGSHHRG
jgi:hypothetical protein